MKIIVCVDNSFGMTFNNRRQSRDKVLIDDIIDTVKDGRLFMSEYSLPLFEGEKVFADEDYLEKAGENDYCFVEREDISDFGDEINEIILYKWNRDYPSDFKFDFDFDDFTLVMSEDFTGNAHEKITKEVYRFE